METICCTLRVYNKNSIPNTLLKNNSLQNVTSCEQKPLPVKIKVVQTFVDLHLISATGAFHRSLEGAPLKTFNNGFNLT